MTRPHGLVALGLFAVCCVMIVCATAFARAQAIWVDESTQLSGLNLGFRAQWLWLAGQMETPFSVPSDRMPPVSYWLGRIWASGFGLTEMSLRAFGIVMGLCAAPTLFLAGRLAGGLAGGLFAAAFLFTSPGFIIQTVEIRAYPIFFCLASWATYVFIRLITQNNSTAENRFMVLLTGILIVMSYTHFYGIVMSGFVFTALLVDRLYTGKPIKTLLVCAAVGSLALIGVIPFIMASIGMTGASNADAGGFFPAMADAIRLVFRLLSSPVLFANQPALVVALASLAVLMFFVISGPMRLQGIARKNQLIFLFPLVAGLIVLTLIRVKIWSFAILAPHYNVWMLPLVSVSFAFAFGLRGLWTKRIIRAAAVCLITAQLTGVATLMTHKHIYSHGSGETIAAQIDDPTTTLVIHDASGLWGQTYFPLVYLTDAQLVQWLSYADGRYQRITRTGLLDIADPQQALQAFDTVVRVNTAALDSQELADITQDPAACQLPRTHLLINTQDTQIRHFCAYFATSYAVSSP